MQFTFGFLASVGISVAAATLGGAQNFV